MHTFAQTAKPSQPPTQETMPTQGRPLPGQRQAMHSHSDVRGLSGDRAIGPVQETHSEKDEDATVPTALARGGHDFSQLAIHAQVAEATETSVSGNKPVVQSDQASGAQRAANSAPPSLFPAQRFGSSFNRSSPTVPALQRKPILSTPNDPAEHEADRVADQVMGLPDLAPIGPVGSAIRHAHPPRNSESGRTIHAKQGPSTSHQSAPGVDAAVQAAQQSGTSLPRDVRSYFEMRFGHDFSAVRIHVDGRAASAAQDVQARAFTVGRDIVFGANEYAPATTEGKRLLAHELTHVVQQAAGPHAAGPHAVGLQAVGPHAVGPQGGVIMRQSAGTRQPPVRRATVQEAAEFLEDMAIAIQGARSFARILVQPIGSTQPTAAARRRAHTMLNQQGLRDMLRNARRVFDVQAAALQGGDPNGTRLRTALLALVAKVREAAADALVISAALPAPTPDAEQRLNAELVLDLIQTDPFTSADMLGTPTFGAAETAAGVSHEAFIEAYLDELIRTIPGQTLAPAARDRILAGINAGLRRAFLTVGTGPAGTADLRAISNPRIVGKYRRVNVLLSAAMSVRPAQLNIITDSLPAYTLPPDPVPDVTAQLQASPTIGAVDLSRVPAIELPYVRHGVLQAARTVFSATSTIQLRNASWPVVLQVRRGGTIARVRYDLIFDASSNVRVERLGEAAPREVAPAFAQLTVPAKKAQLITDFRLAAVDDRPAAPGRTAATWTADELDQVKAAYDLIPAGDRSALAGVTIVRDHQGPAQAVAGQILTGLAHTAASPAHDSPVPPTHGPPHIHYYDSAFAQNAVTGVGAPGSSGPGGDWTLAHEVGHMRVFLATRQANAAVVAANQQIVTANAGLPALNAPLPQAQHQLRQAYAQARTTANTAIQALNAGIIGTPPSTPAQRAALLQPAQAAVAARDLARQNLAASGVPAGMVQAATSMDAAMDALLAATQSMGVAQDQIPTFIALAGSFGFTPFTDYARQGGNDEFFAEAYALFLTDPNRLSSMNRSIFLWFEAGMPMNPAWRPTP